MQAAVIETLGQPPRVVDQDPPQPDPGQLTIIVTAAPIIPFDQMCASGTTYLGAPATPYVPGAQGVGIVHVGNASIVEGTVVWFHTMAGLTPCDGSMRAVVTVDEVDVVPLPAGAEPALVAALGLSAVAAWMALTRRGELQPGEQVLVLGAGGIVGQAGVQLARSLGARRVIAAARSGAAQERARRASPDALVVLDDGAGVEGMAEAMRAQCDGPLDLVLDPLFGVPAAAALRVLRPHGRLVNLGSSAAETAPIESVTLRKGSLRVLGYSNNDPTPQARNQALGRVVEESVAGRLTVDHELVPLAEVAAAWSRQAAGQASGRIVLVPEDPRLS